MSSGQPQPSQQGEPIRLTPEQLERFRQQTAEEIEQLSDLLRQLRVANNKFVDSKHSVELMGKDKEGV
ncbi:hypothetical protein BLNAU_18731 [Blattamonas nauphoetae]|nr:hypothetical protein BLNAU_18731 [Blattamonas nauphoetae]